MRAWILVVADQKDVPTLACCRIAVINRTGILIIARAEHKLTNPSCRVAAVVSAQGTIVTDNRRIHATNSRITRIKRAHIIVVAINKDVLTASRVLRVTTINCASIIVVTVPLSPNALARQRMAIIHGAGITVVANLRLIYATEIRVAPVNGALVPVVTEVHFVDASARNGMAVVGCAWVLVIAV